MGPLRIRLSGPQSWDEWYLTVIYVLVHVGAFFLLQSDSPAMSDLLEWMYIPWMVSFYVSSVILLFGFFLRIRVVEAMALPVVEAGLLSYAVAVLTNPPYDNQQLGLAVGCFLLIGCVSIGWRYGHDLMKWKWGARDVG